jgi:N4-gp56 family major capsid protein
MESITRYGKRALTLVLALLSFLVGCPVAFGMADEVSTTTLTNDQATEYIAEKTLRTALVRLAAYQFAEKHALPKNSGRLFQMTRYEHLTLPQLPIQQGVTPDNTPMTINKVTAMAEQWGAVITMYDVALLTTQHDVLQKAIELLGIQAAKVFERECQRVLMSATGVAFAGTSNTTRNGLATGDVLSSTDIQQAVATLRDNGAEDWTRTEANTSKAYLERMAKSGGGTTGLIGLVDSFVEQDIVKDSTFVVAAQYSNIRALYAGEVGKYLGVVWVRSNYMPKITLLASPTVASSNMTGFSGGLSVSTAYDVSVTRIRKAYGLEEAVSALINISTDSGHDSISVVLPSDSAYMYRIYLGTDGGTRYLVTSASSAVTVAADDITGPAFEGGQTVYVTAVPTSGDASPVDPASGVTVHTTWIFGREAFGCVDLAKLEATLTPNAASDSDPLKQRRKAAWKAMFKCAIQNNAFIRLIESSSAFSA